MMDIYTAYTTTTTTTTDTHTQNTNIQTLIVQGPVALFYRGIVHKCIHSFATSTIPLSATVLLHIHFFRARSNGVFWGFLFTGKSRILDLAAVDNGQGIEILWKRSSWPLQWYILHS